jgi:O-acetyl-ADP-ribose deacetylase (regulator of RNase III)
MHGGIFDSTAEGLVNPVNCVGVMGAGLAAQFKARFPANNLAYVAACVARQVKIGMVFTHETGGAPKYIFNFPTKRHWAEPSRIEFIQEGLIALRGELERTKAASVAVPALGCGLGGLSWEQVGPLILEQLAGLEAKIMIYGPQGWRWQ